MLFLKKALEKSITSFFYIIMFNGEPFVCHSLINSLNFFPQSLNMRLNYAPQASAVLS